MWERSAGSGSIARPRLIPEFEPRPGHWAGWAGTPLGATPPPGGKATPARAQVTDSQGSDSPGLDPGRRSFSSSSSPLVQFQLEIPLHLVVDVDTPA